MSVSGGVQTRSGRFSAPAGIQQNLSYIQTALASRYSNEPVYRKWYYCNLISQCTFGSWLYENMGYDTSCFTNYSLVHEYPAEQFLPLNNGAPIVVPASPTTVNITLPAAAHFIAGAYIFPQIGYGLLLPPEGAVAVITNITPATNATVITIRLKTGGPVTIPVQSQLIVLSAKELADCDCPTGRIKLQDGPVIQDVAMKAFGDGTGEICGDALLACQNLKFAYDTIDENGQRINHEHWYGGALLQMMKDFEKSQDMIYLFDQTFGIFPTLRQKSIRWNWANPAEVDEEDFTEFKNYLLAIGRDCKEYAWFLGSDAYATVNRFMNSISVGKISYGCFNPEDCKHLNLDFCSFTMNGITHTFYEECAFSSHMAFGGNGWNWKNRGVGIPMCDRPNPGSDSDTKMFTTVFFKDNLGRVWDKLMDSNGILNGPGGRNTYGTGCDKHDWTIKSRFVGEIHCPEMWVLLNWP